MPELNLFQIFVRRLNKAKMKYMVTGAVACIIYGEPRLTHDIDLVIELRNKDAKKILEAFPQNEFYCPPLEMIKLEVSRPMRGHFNLVHHDTGFKADVYLLGQDELHQGAMSHRRRYDMEGEPIWLAPPEYVILRKLEYYREGGSEKHLKDIAGIMEISANQLNFDELCEKIKKYSLQQQWEEARKLRDL